MYRALLATCLLAACIARTPPSHEPRDGGGSAGPPKAAPPGRDADLTQARFFARTPGGTNPQALALEGLAVDVATGPEATRTHLVLTVGNPGDAQVEAVMRLPVPPGAAVTRAVLHVGDRPMEGAFVARDRARTIYRSITERRRDPALITWSGPDWIELSVFPVEKKDKRIVELEWIEPTASRNGCVWYRVPALANEGREVKRPSRVVVDGVAVETLGRSWLPLVTQGMVGTAAAARTPGDPFGYAFSSAQERKPGPRRLVLAAETSQRMSAADRSQQRAVIERLMDRLPEDAGVTLLAVDWVVAAVAENATPAEVRAALDHLDGIPSAGALDLESALRVASTRALAVGAQAVVFLGHGTDRFPGDALAVPLGKLQEAGQTLVVIGGEASPIADAAALTGGQSFAWTAAGDAVRAVLTVLDRTPAKLTLANAEKFFPLETVTGETRWLARFTGSAPDGVARGEARELEALWVRAHVAATAGRDGEQGERHHVLTPLTSILVLESMADYGRWGIAAPEPIRERRFALSGNAPDRAEAERRARDSGILGLLKADPGVGLGSIFGRDSALGLAPADVLGGPVGDSAGAAFGVGGLGLVGTGTGGGGTGEGTMGLGNFGTIGKGGGGGNGSGYGRGAGGLGNRRARAPDVVPGQITVRGSLDKEIIRRIARRHINELRYCYDTQLDRQRTLAGRITVQFVIGPGGEVKSSLLQSSTMNDYRVEACVVQAVRRWEFPKPYGGGMAVVSYPFKFNPQDHVDVGSAATASQKAAPTPPSSWDEALAALRDKGELKERLAKVAAAVETPVTDSPAVLAWWIVERHLRAGEPVAGACILAANLLREANQPHEAARVLSEGAEVDLAAVTAELRRWGSRAEVARLGELAARK